MSPLDSMVSSLETMGFAQLGCAFVAILSYAFALNASLRLAMRWWAGFAALVSAATFSALTPSWVSGVALMGVAIVFTGAFVAGTWLLAALFGLRTTSGSIAEAADAAEDAFEVAPSVNPQALRDDTRAGPLSLPAPSR